MDRMVYITGIEGGVSKYNRRLRPQRTADVCIPTTVQA